MNLLEDIAAGAAILMFIIAAFFLSNGVHFALVATGWAVR